MASKSTATYKPKPGEGKARTRKQAKEKTWTAEDAKNALGSGGASVNSPETEDAFTPTPPHHPEGKKMAARPPGTAQHRPPSKDLWDEAERLAEVAAAEQQESGDEPEKQVDTPLQSSDVTVPELPAVSSTPEAADLVAAAMAEATKRLTAQIGIDPILLTKMAAYMSDRCRVTLELQDCTFSMSVMNLVVSKYSVTLLIPLDPKATTFVPKPGTKVTLTRDDFCEDVYFPGAYVEIEPMMLAIMTFIRTDGSET